EPTLGRRELKDSREDYSVEALILDESKRTVHETWILGKINFDGAFDPHQARSGSEVVARNSSEEIMASMTICHKCVTIEGNSLTIIKKAKSISKEKSKIDAIVTNIQQYKERFQHINFRHISRLGNSLAHHLAKASLEKGEDIYLVGGIPD
ncbi:hypothetical protein Goari_006256, partial [Gossypium aridum]|nr:hypothetical protein [Gossypium aridum]